MNKLEYSTKTRPQRLCKACGKCCTMAVCQYTKEELEQFSECKESEAGDFLSVFTPYKNLDIPRTISTEYVDFIVNKLKEQNKFDEKEPIFLKCKHSMPGGACAIYENRFGWCRRAPRHAWTIMPCGCGFEGWQFGLREQIKHSVRVLKEYLYECEITYGHDGIVPGKNITVRELTEKIKSKIAPYERFGAFYW